LKLTLLALPAFFGKAPATIAAKERQKMPFLSADSSTPRHLLPGAGLQVPDE
jgi:hypothetical protein